MSTDSKISDLSSSVNGTPGTSTQPAKKKNDQLGQTEFLQLLVQQLKTQDPLNPMNSEDFAVNLAQFSQLEQLVSINEKVTPGGGGSDIGSLASYLGQEVVLNSDSVNVKDSNGGLVGFNLGAGASNVRIDLVDAAGEVRASQEMGAMDKGRHSIELAEVSLADGEYRVVVNALGQNGQPLAVEASAAGIVTGFVPGDDPKLLIGDREVRTPEIKEVHLGAGA